MTQTVYTFDPHGIEASCLISNESRAVPALGGRFRCIIPSAAPFYRKDFVVKFGARTLVEGKDFYFGHQYVRGTHQTAQMIYGSIVLLDNTVTSAVKLTYRTLGGQYTVTDAVITAYLTNALTDPTTARWEDVMGNDLFFPPVDIRYDIEQWIGEKELEVELSQLAKAIRNQNPTQSDSFDLYDRWINEQRTIVDDSHWAAHLVNYSNPHNTKWYEAGALKSDGIAQNADMFNGQDLPTFTATVNAAQGLTSSVAGLFPINAERVMTGSLTLRDAMSSLWCGGSGPQFLFMELSAGNQLFQSITNVSITADQLKNTPGVYASVEAGNNVLKVVSSGSGIENNKLFFNDYQVFTTETLTSGVPVDANNSINLSYVQTSPIIFSGKGSTTNPLKADFTIPVGSYSQFGVLQLTSDLTFDGVNLKAATPAAINKLRLLLANLVPTTVTINNQPLTSNITLTVEDLGLDQVNNTSDLAKGINAQYLALLGQYASTQHTHKLSLFDPPAATTDVAGIAMMNNDIDTVDIAGADDAIDSNVVDDLYDRVHILDQSAKTKMLNNAMDLVQYGDNNYLPIPATGAFVASGMATTTRTQCFFVEASGKLVILRNGKDLVSDGVFYSYADIDSAGNISNYVPTIALYAPAFLSAGSTVTKVIHNSDTAMLVEVTNTSGVKSLRFVLLNGTFDGTQHNGSAVNGITYTPDNTDSNAQRNSLRMYPFIVGNYCYIAIPACSGTDPNNAPVLTLYRAPKAPLATNAALTFTPMTLTGNDLYGLPQSATTVSFTAKGLDTNIANRPLLLVGAGVSANWLQFGIMHTGLAVDANNNKAKVIIGGAVYASTATGETSLYWNFSVTVNLATGAFSIDDDRTAPVTVGADWSISGNMSTTDKTLRSSVFPNAAWDSECFTTHVGGYRFSARQHHAFGIFLDTWKPVNDGLSLFDSFATWATQRTEISNIAISGKFGGASRTGLTGIAVTPGMIYGYNKTDGVKWKRGFSLNGSVPYSQTMAGLYPTDLSIAVTPAEMAHARAGIYYLANNGTALGKDGVVLSKTYLTGNATYNSAASITAANLEAIRAAIQSDLGVTPFDSYVMLYIPTNPTHPALAVFHWMDTPVNGNYARRLAFYPVTLSTRTGVTAMTVLGLRIAQYAIANDGIAYDFNRKEHNSSAIMQMSSGNLLYLMNASYISSYRGWAAYETFQIQYDVTNLTWSALQIVAHDDNWNAGGLAVVPKYGLAALSVDVSSSAVIGTYYGFNPTNVTNFTVQGQFVLYSSQVLNGSQVYFTEVEPYINNGLACSMPITTLDLAALYPDQWTNRKFYLYVVTTPGAGVFSTYWYGVKTTQEADNANQTYIGYVTTDSVKITNIVVNRVTKLGYFQELLDHINNPTAHGLTSATKSEIGLPLVVNKAPRYQLKTGLFNEVFNSWHRFSHGAMPYSTATWTQPALSSELTAWKYSSADDTVTCTQNSVSYIGFVSTNPVADYTFDTVVGVKGTSTDTDDDVIALVIGYAEVNGVEHTLSVLRMANAVQSGDFGYVAGMQLGVYYDFHLPDQKTVKTVDTSAVDGAGAWKGRFARIRVTRTGNTYVVKSTAIAANNWATVVDTDFIYTMTFTLDDLPELAIFKGSTRYGYASLSQLDSTYINYQRPDEDGKNYYATAIEAVKACYFADRLTIVSGTITHGGVLPIPDGYTASQCRFFLMPDTATLGSGVSKGIKGINLTYDAATLAVTSTVTRTDGVTYAMQAAYVVAAVSDFKLFK